MTAGLVAGLVAILLAALLTPLVRTWALSVGAVDAPGGRRVHAEVTPRLGGVAIVLAYLAAVVTCISTGLLRRFVWDWSSLWVFLGGGLVIALAGVVDDVRGLGAKRKLLMQCTVATMVWIGGARVATTVFLPGLGQVFIGAPLSYVATLIWVVAFINAINLIDGLDGLAGGVVFFATVTNLIVAIVTGNALAAVLNAALGGAVLGFLFYNFNPATIFMGDTGSMFLGYALGTAALLTARQKESTLVSLLVPVIALGVPFTDTLLALVRRVLARRSIFAADREHLHHRLLDLGITHRRAVLIMYGCSLLLCLAAVGAALGQNWQVGAAIVGAVLTLTAITRFAGYFQIVLRGRQQRGAALHAQNASVRRALPALILGTDAAASPAGVWAAVERFLTHGDFVYAEYRPDGEGASWTWGQEEGPRRSEGKVAENSFVIRPFPGDSVSSLRFECARDEDAALLELEILLQIAADAVEAALVRIHVRSPTSMVRAVTAAST